jgi:hypothetical protein
MSGRRAFVPLCLAVLTLCLVMQVAPADARAQSADAAEYALVHEVADALRATGGEVRALAALRRDAALTRAAHEELVADALVSETYGMAPLVADDVAKRLAAEASGPLRAELESALELFRAVEKVENPDEPASQIEQKRRVEAALEAARAAGSMRLAIHALSWLGVYALEGGDLDAAKRYLGEAAAGADLSRHAHEAFEAHWGLSRAHGLEADAAAARSEAEAARLALERIPAEFADAKETVPVVLRTLVDLNARAGDRERAIAVARDWLATLERWKAPAPERADVWERIGQLHAQGAGASPEEAPAASRALEQAGKLWIEAKEPAKGVVALTAAGVVALENVGGDAAIPYFVSARDAAASRVENAAIRYWIARAHAARASWAEALRAYEEAVGLLDALDREKSPQPELRMLIHHWYGRAWLESERPDAAKAIVHFRRSFDAALETGAVNDAVTSGEMILRTIVARGDRGTLAAEAKRLFDRLVASDRIEPLNAARPLAWAIERAEERPGRLDPVTVALYDHAAAALDARKEPGKAAAARAALVADAAGEADRAVLSARAQKAFDDLMAAGDLKNAEGLAGTTAAAWIEIGDRAEASRWLDRYVALAEKRYEIDLAANRVEGALGAARGLESAAHERGDREAETTWARAGADLRRRIAEEHERGGKLGLASSAYRGYGESLALLGDHAGARGAYARAGSLAEKTLDREAHALSLARQAAAELATGDARAALATARTALGLSSSAKLAGEHDLPPAATIVYREIAAEALATMAAAYDALASPHAAAARQLAADLKQD